MATEKRLILAKVLEQQIKEAFKDNPYVMGQMLRWIRKQPTVDAVEVVHGRWEVIEASDELYKCSACGEWQYIPEEHFAYCPYCGAKMDKNENL